MTEAEMLARDGYDRMAHEYFEHVHGEAEVPSLTRAGLQFLVHRVQQSGSLPVADVGCGPGHMTAYLAELGLDIFGVDISPALLDIAKANHPDVRFEVGELASLPVANDSLQGLISKHSLIHTPAALVPDVLCEFARVLVPGGILWLSFFAAVEATSHGEGFDHAVTTAYQFDIDRMAELLATAGFAEEARIVRQPRPSERQLPHCAFYARLT